LQSIPNDVIVTSVCSALCLLQGNGRTSVPWLVVGAGSLRARPCQHTCAYTPVYVRTSALTRVVVARSRTVRRWRSTWEFTLASDRITV